MLRRLTFSLAHLLIAITVVCTVSGLAVNYPDELVALLAIFFLFVPLAIICLTLISLARSPQTVLVFAMFGAFIANACGPPVFYMGPQPITLWDAVLRYCLPIAISAALGALFVGGAALLYDLLQSLNQPPTNPPDSHRNPNPKSQI